MKLSILLITLFIVSFSFNIGDSSTQPHTSDAQNVKPSQQLGDCSAGQTDAVYSVIKLCEVSDLDTTCECISDQITKAYASQQWNVVIKNTAENKDTVLFWRFNNCYLNLVKYGKFNRTYVIWPVKTYLNGTSQLNNTQTVVPKKSEVATRMHKLTNFLQSQPNADNCPSWKKSTVSKIIKLCSIDGNDAAAGCIFDKVHEQLGEYWNVLIQTSVFGTSYDYFYFASCYVQTDGTDTYRRYINVWRAH